MKNENKIRQSSSERSSTARLTIINAFMVLAVALFYVSAAEAHTFHTSLARMDYNARDKHFEVTIQLFTHDLQPLLERRLKKRIDLEKTAGVETEIQKYLADNFILQSKTGETKKHRWIGREFENDTIYVYLEIPFAEDFAGAKLQNTIFFESFPKQTNLVVARFGENKIDLLFKAGDKFKEF